MLIKPRIRWFGLLSRQGQDGGNEEFVLTRPAFAPSQPERRGIFYALMPSPFANRDFPFNAIAVWPPHERIAGMKLFTHNLGFPRIGPRRELKKALESYWARQSSQEALLATATEIQNKNWKLQKQAGIDLIPSNDFSFYDHVLDTCTLVGAIPSRFGGRSRQGDLDTYFAMARGGEFLSGTEYSRHAPQCAMEMTKWFDTNYHYLVPEFLPGQEFSLCSDKAVYSFLHAKAQGVHTTPVLLGPISFLLLGKTSTRENNFNLLSLLPGVLPVYETILRQLSSAGANWIQIDEPMLSCDLSDEQLAAFGPAYTRLRSSASSIKLLLTTYFGGLRSNLSTVLSLPVDALHIDAVRAPEELNVILSALPDYMALSVGVVDGRNIWRNHFSESLKLLHQALDKIGPGRLMVSLSCSLLHCPVSLRHETRLDPELKSWMAFSEEKLHEISTLAHMIEGSANVADIVANQRAIFSRQQSPRIHNAEVLQRSAAVTETSCCRINPYPLRRQAQEKRFRLPPLPTTTIGSFPQTREIRAARAQWKSGELSLGDYEYFLEQATLSCVRFQQEAGLDVLVHGEFERNDMVEYFGEKLSGFVFTQNGWVQSYGSRCVKPPVIYGDVHRIEPMTVRWSKFAQSLTSKPMKGMLTGPITILQWSFVRDDQARRLTARQIALAIRDEVCALEAAGIGIIQIDEPALREGLPLRLADRPAYLAWATEAFRLATAAVRDETQIHTHMCYGEFDDIMGAIVQLDADVISIEASRSGMELLRTFAYFQYPNEIGPGIWDIHSPRIPGVGELESLIHAALQVIPEERLWINPDCGLKTRGWNEVKSSLRNLVTATRNIRKELANNLTYAHKTFTY
jgi:5-methyltetrahydropteroyltriglutamate--homocysteine methyltransferase